MDRAGDLGSRIGENAIAKVTHLDPREDKKGRKTAASPGCI
jgi:hypothetical protein